MLSIMFQITKSIRNNFMKKILLTLLLTLFSFSLLADEKPGRFFKDQPDANNDYQLQH